MPRPSVRLLLATVALLGVVGGGWAWLRESSLVEVRRVSVSGLSGPNAARARTALEAAARDMTTLNLRAGELVTAVEPFPAIAGVRAEADFPHGLRIEVRERTAIGAIVAAGQSVAVAGDGTLLRGTPSARLVPIAAKAPPGGPRASDPSLRGAVALLAAAPRALRARARRLYEGPRGWTVPLRDGPTLYFGGPARPRAKWIAAATVLADERSAGAAYLDLRIPERPAAGGLEAAVIHG